MWCLETIVKINQEAYEKWKNAEKKQAESEVVRKVAN